MRRAITAGLAVLLAAGTFGIGWWAGSTALEPPRDPLVTSDPVTVTAVHGEVGSRLELGGQAEWEAVSTLVSPTDGTVTSVNQLVEPLGAGAAVVHVDLVPVVLAQGEVPAFRDMEDGVSGPDVEQLQQFLAQEGHFAETVDGEFGETTTDGVNAWRQQWNLPADGTVPLGMIMFVPDLPVSGRLLVGVGDRVAADEPIAEALAPTPTFRAVVTEDQLAMVPEGTTVRLTRDEHQLTSVAGSTTEVDGVHYLALEGLEGSEVCPSPCDQVPRTDGSRWIALAELVPPQTGVLLPSAAVRTDAGGETYVVLDDGSTQPVQPGASSDGRVIVTGLDEGAVIQLPFSPSGADEP